MKFPTLYIDMDGVLCDFAHSWAKFERVHHWTHIADPDQSIKRLALSGDDVVEDFFTNLPPLVGGKRLRTWVERTPWVPWRVLSSPMFLARDAAIRGKRAWLQRHWPAALDHAIFSHHKYKWATAKGRPNILVDDFDKFLIPWHRAGGVAIKHDDELTDLTIARLDRVYRGR